MSRSWVLPVLTFVAMGPVVGGLAFLLETVAVQAATGGHLPTAGELSLIFRVIVAAYIFGVVPSALTGYFHFYARGWFRNAVARTIATCTVAAFLAALLAVLGGQGGVILAYALAGAIAAVACVVLTDRLFPKAPA